MNITKSRYGYLALTNSADLISTSITTYGEWAQNEIWLIERLVKRGQTVLDIGAYIGTHTLALAEFIGIDGFIHSFDPHPQAQLSLKACIEINNLNNAKLHAYALGAVEQIVDPDSSKFDPNNLGSFSLNQSNQVEDNQEGFLIKTLDSVKIDKCDFIKIDVEGMEISVLKGGERTISKNRPIIMCECNFLENGAPLISWALKNRYVVQGVELSAFNPYNHAKNDKNIFADAGEVSLLLIPIEKSNEIKPLLIEYSAMEIITIDDLALLMMRKPQYIIEVENQRRVIDKANPAAPIYTNKKFSLEINKTKDISANLPNFPHKFNVVVPFYKNPQLVRPLFNSLIDCSDELTQLNAKIYFYNDSPNDVALADEFAKCLRDNRKLNFTVITNKDNLGFVGTANEAFNNSIEAREDIILLNSDTIVFPGVFLELANVAYSDHMIGFVSPRSNNATLCTFPHGADLLEISPFECFSRYKSASKNLPRWTYVPTAVGFCLYIKWSILVELGGFDLAYGKGYNEENDLIMRANRLGYRAVLANKAFVWHQGEQSFGKMERKKEEREKVNSKLLNSRYPEYSTLIQEYFDSPEYRAEKLISELSPNINGHVKIGFDFSNFGTYHNGTFEAGKSLLFAAENSWPSDIEIVVFISPQSWEFHRLSECTRAKWIDPNQSDEKLAAVIRMGQPFDSHSIMRMLNRAPVVSIFMLDTIAYDCGYLKIGFDVNLWHFTMRWFDIVFTNSEFTAEQFVKRFQIGPSTKIHPSLHSITPNEYTNDLKNQDTSTKTNASNSASSRSPRVLVIGNKFEHKALVPTVKHLSAALPNFRFTALGCSGLTQENVTSIDSGALSDEELNILYSEVDAIVFPSHYEGFGFPIMHALTREKPIYVRKIPVFEEIESQISIGRENIKWFESTRDLTEKLTTDSFSWIGPTSVGEINGWNRSALEVLEVLQNSMNSITSSIVADRIRWGELALNRFYSEKTSDARIDQATRFILIKFEKFIKIILKSPAAYSSLRFFHRLLSGKTR